MTFEELYIGWYSRMKAFAREYIHSEAEAENIVQDVFLSIYEKKLHQQEGLCQAAYIFTILKNRCIDRLRSRLWKTQSLSSADIDRICETEDGPKWKGLDTDRLELQLSYESLKVFDTDFESDEQVAKLLEDALAALPERCREIFIKTKIEGRSQKAVAEELGISVKTIEAQMTIAYRKLREELKDFLPLLLFLFAGGLA